MVVSSAGQFVQTMQPTVLSTLSESVDTSLLGSQLNQFQWFQQGTSEGVGRSEAGDQIHVELIADSRPMVSLLAELGHGNTGNVTMESFEQLEKVQCDSQLECNNLQFNNQRRGCVVKWLERRAHSRSTEV